MVVDITNMSLLPHFNGMQANIESSTQHFCYTMTQLWAVYQLVFSHLAIRLFNQQSSYSPTSTILKVIVLALFQRTCTLQPNHYSEGIRNSAYSK
jgi:hypothetical protein